MKTLILGKKGIGKTVFIQEKFIPTLKEFTVVDLCFEYNNQINAPYAHYHLAVGLNRDEMKQFVVSDLKTSYDGKENTWILESLSLIDDDFTWLEELIKDKNVAMTFQSIQSLENKKVPDIFDEIYFFPTMDSDDVRTKYLAEQMAKGTKVHIMNGRL